MSRRLLPFLFIFAHLAKTGSSGKNPEREERNMTLPNETGLRWLEAMVPSGDKESAK